MKRLMVFVLICSAFANAQTVEYHISFENASHHEAEITVKFSGISSKPLEVRMSRTSPGRYALHEFAKNVYNVKAVDGKGKTLRVTRPNPHQWDIAGHDGTVVVSYTLFGDHADGTYSGIDLTHAHLNMPATFIWARGLDDAPITITFNIPKESHWKIATQLFATKQPSTFTSPGLQYFMDCPTELSNYSYREWTIPSRDTLFPVGIALHHSGTEEQFDAYAALAKNVTYEEKAVYGELPSYDVHRYTFIADYLPYVNGDGMEHRNSTINISTRPMKTSYLDHLGTLAHEYFHSWNVERMRPKSLEPFNFEEANMSGELWFAEGVTNYYGTLILKRAKVYSLDRYAKNISGTLSYVITSPARKFFSPVEMSMQAPFVDAATSIDETNRRNTFISYYSYGEVIGLGLDLTLRTKFPGKTMDDFIRAVWKKHGKTEIPYTNEDLRTILGEVTGDGNFTDEFFRKYIYGHDVVDYAELLSHAGFLLRKSKEKKASLGDVYITYDDGKATIGAGTIINSPLYNAGLDRRDRILKLDGMTISASKDIDSVLAKHKPGETVEIEFEQRGTPHTAKLTFEEQQQLEVVPYEQASMPVTEAMTAFREQWLGTHVQEKLPDLVRYCSTCKRTFPFEYEFCHFDGDTLKLVLEHK
jgi:predicted metalloprotease with PDZ domain